MPLYVSGAQAAFDDRRNTSRVRLPDPNALGNCLRSLALLRRDQAALVRWIEDGHPTLTEAEHVERFGAPYDAPKGRRRAA